MSTMGTFGTFTTARLGIYAAMKGLSVTGNNISNINTDGYTRQSLEQVALKTGGSDRYQSEYDAKVGTGVLVTGVSQARDSYLDIRYRTQMASVGSMDTWISGLDNVADIIDEVGDGDNEGDGIVEAQLSDLFETLENLDVNAGHNEYDSQVRASASSLCTLLNNYSKKLAEVKENTVAQMYNCVDEINEILSNIRDLNSQIRKSEIHGDDALEMRDDRNELIDQLAEYMKIDVTYEMEELDGGEQVEKLVIRLGNANENSTVGYDGRGSDQALLVDGIYATQISIATADVMAAAGDVGNDELYDNDEKAGEDMYNIIVSALQDAKGNAWSETTTISPEAYTAAQGSGTTFAVNGGSFSIDNQDGSISTYTATTQTTKAGGATTVYTKTTYSQNYMLDDNDLYGTLQSYRELLTESGEFASANMITRDVDSSTKRGITYYQKALDLLANQIANAFNSLNVNYESDADGNYLDTAGNTVDYNGVKLNQSMTQSEIEAALTDLKNNGTTVTLQTRGDVAVSNAGTLFSNSGNGNDPTGITAANISISNSWANGTTRIVKSFTETVAGAGVPSTASDNIDRFVALLNQDLDYTAGQVDRNAKNGSVVMFTGSFQEMLTEISGNLGKDLRSSNVLLDTYNAAATELDTSRDSVSGVDLNDEAMSLMQYQKSYSAACRLMTTLDEVLDKLINGTAV